MTMADSGVTARVAAVEPARAPAWRPRVERWSFDWTMRGIAAVAMLLLVAPTLIVLITSFTSGYSLKFPPDGYSLRWYSALWTTSPELIQAALLSLRVAAVATLVSCFLAVSAALGLARSRTAWSRVVDALLMSPLMLPTLVLGLALLLMLSLSGIALSPTTLILGHITIITPYILRTSSAALAQLDGTLLECALSLGAGSGLTFRAITFPLILPSVAAGAFIAFMASFDNVAVSLFLSDARSEVLPIRMWQILESSLDVRAAAVSGVLIGATLLLMLVMEKLVGISRHLR
jgi:putative spermidine/putrescine transport system permease protein